MHQNLLDKSNHHQCIVDGYEKSMAQIQEELTQTKAKLVELEKDREKTANLSQLTISCSGETGEQKWVSEKGFRRNLFENKGYFIS